MANTKITPHVLDGTLISGHSTVTAATNDFVLIQDVSDSNALKKALVSDLAQNEENPTFTGVVTANAGVIVDNITIDGTEIDLSSGDLTIDVAGDIILDADGSDIRLLDAGTEWGRIQNGTGSQLILQSKVSDEDMLFQGNDGGSNITALTLDMSDAGAAQFNSRVGIGVASHSTAGLNITNTSQHIRLNNGSELGIINLDSDGNLDLWAHGADETITFRNGTGSGTVLATIGSTESVFNEASNDIDFRVESNDHTHMLFVDGGTNRVGINNPSSATAPVFPFVVWDDDEVTILGHGNNATYIQRYQTHATAPATLVFDKARGTQASPTTVSPGDDLSRILFRGYTNNGYYEAASIHAEANVSNLVNDGADIPSDLYFKTTRDGGSGPLERLRIDYDGAIWHRHGNYGRYQWTKSVAFSAGQTQNLKFHLNGSNVYGQVRVTMSGDYGNVNANGSFEKAWGWGYNSSNTSNYGGGGAGTTMLDVGSTSNVLVFGSMSKINNTTVKIPIENTAASYSLNAHIHVEITGELAGLGYTSIS